MGVEIDGVCQGEDNHLIREEADLYHEVTHGDVRVGVTEQGFQCILRWCEDLHVGDLPMGPSDNELLASVGGIMCCSVRIYGICQQLS